MSYRVEVEAPVPEQTSWQLAGNLTKNDGVTALPLAELATFTATLYVLDANRTAIFTAHNLINIPGGRGVVNTDGSFVVTLRAADNVIQDATKRAEKHVLLLRWTFGTGQAGTREYVLVVKNLDKLP